MLPTADRARRTAAPALLTAALLAGLPAASADAKPKPKVTVVGWTTQPVSQTPQVKGSGQTIDQCMDTAGGQRNLFAIYRGKGVGKGTKVAAAIWGGPPGTGQETEPATADLVKRNGFAWPVPPRRSYTTTTGFGIAPGPFGPISLNGLWNAKVVLKGEVVATSTVTIAC